jgi:hypothetical protein
VTAVRVCPETAILSRSVAEAPGPHARIAAFGAPRVRTVRLVTTVHKEHPAYSQAPGHSEIRLVELCSEQAPPSARSGRVGSPLPKDKFATLAKQRLGPDEQSRPGLTRQNAAQGR